MIGGQTLHGWGGLGLAKEPATEIIRRLLQRPRDYQRWKTVQVLIIDEVSMMSAELFNKIHSIAQGIRHSTDFFGGIQVILSGDFAQLDPIGSDKYCFESKIWTQYVTPGTIYFPNVLRQSDPVFCRVLSNIRLGVLTDEDRTVLNSRLMSDESEADIIVTGSQERIKATVLYPLKRDVHRINTVELDRLLDAKAESRSFKSDDSVANRKTKVPATLKSTHTETLNKCTNAPDILVLAVGAQVMLIKNKSVEEGLVNGSRGVVLEFSTAGSPLVMFDNGHQVLVAPEAFEVESGDCVVTRKQVPLILAWAMTIHKCQGATLTNVITDLSDIFGYAQAYVTLSRVRSLEGLFIVSINYSKIRCNPKVKQYYASLCPEVSGLNS
jgi:ATP-dependent DNA helicase PIF1